MSVLTLKVAGQVFADWTRAEIGRSLTDICGGFRLEYDDQVRMQSTLPRSATRFGMVAVQPGDAVRIELDGELVMLGWIDEVEFDLAGDQVRAMMTGRDLVGDLVDCTAMPNGPHQFAGLTVLQIAQRLTAEYPGITVRAEVDVGAPLPDYHIDAAEPVMSALDKAVKQRAVLLTSDGVGGLVLTRSGFRRSPAPLMLPGNVVAVQARSNWRERYSDYYVRGHSKTQRQGRRAALDGTAAPLTARPAPGTATAAHARKVSMAGLDGTATPLGATPPPIVATPTSKPHQVERSGIIQAGHAVDPAVTRHRPRVWLLRTASGGAPAQTLAEWRMRIARGKSQRHGYTVQGWRAGEPDARGVRRLWRPNETVEVRAGYADGFDMLVEGVSYHLSDEEGSRTLLAVVGREAYDLEPLPDTHRRHSDGGKNAQVTAGVVKR